ncbi:MAG: hypothetical protein ABIJ34_06670 [archaeon]
MALTNYGLRKQGQKEATIKYLRKGKEKAVNCLQWALKAGRKSR